jgi:hypothetical protein
MSYQKLIPMYLGACAKGSNTNSLRSQPFSNIKAKQRAFCFKNSYMIFLLGNILEIIQTLDKCFA